MPRKKKQVPDQPVPDRAELEEPLNAALESDAAVEAQAEAVAATADTFDQASDNSTESVVAEATVPVEESVSPERSVAIEEMKGSEADEEPAPASAARLERLQKILAQAGIASRRHAEALITEGRVQVNGKVVTELGSKADPQRDHIRVDGKLLQGSERHRYFMLNKPKGYVTTVSDPEGRPTIMEFFAKTRERLYPVGRLDYLSEGLLLVTNDGELANKLTRAASNVEKTYLVKVSGQPSEEDLDRLRQGVGIVRGKPGSGRVQTAPAQIRLFRPGKAGSQRGGARSGENPWYEVVIIEGRNRELRKMFEEIGHHVEKIRRIGYGPLELDLEPGKIRELDPQEVENLRKAAEGKYRKLKSREPRKRESARRSERLAAEQRWSERRPDFKTTREKGSRPERRPFRRDQGGFQHRPQSSRSGPPERDRFRAAEPSREFRPGTRPNPRFAENRPPHPPRRADQQSPSAGTRENRGRFNQPTSPESRPQRAWNKPDRESRPPRFDRKQGSAHGRRPNQFQRNDRRTPGEFRPGPVEGRPQRLDRKRSAPSGDFSSRKRLEILPADEEPRSPEARPQGPNRSERPPFQPRGGPRQGRSGFQPSDRTQQRRHSQAGPRPFNRDRQEQPRSDRPRRNEGRGGPSANRPGRSDRRPDPRSSSTRPSGSFKSGKRGASGGKQGGGKQGSVRSAGGRRSGPRPGGKRPNKRHP
jgi:23S rRNA pseudouridine2605 synthase